MSTTTRVIRFHRTGGPEVLRIEKVRLPKPTGMEVLVRVQAVALSRPDLVWREGSYFEEPVFPAQIGYEAAGVVESIGPEVKSLKVFRHRHRVRQSSCDIMWKRRFPGADLSNSIADLIGLCSLQEIALCSRGERAPKVFCFRRVAQHDDPGPGPL